jgi:hypothetical protein
MALYKLAADKLAGLGFFGVEEPSGQVARIKKRMPTNQTRLMYNKRKQQLSDRKEHLNKIKDANFRPLKHLSGVEDLPSKEEATKAVQERMIKRPDLVNKVKGDFSHELKRELGDHPMAKKLNKQMKTVNSAKGLTKVVSKNWDGLKSAFTDVHRNKANISNQKSLELIRKALHR